MVEINDFQNNLRDIRLDVFQKYGSGNAIINRETLEVIPLMGSSRGDEISVAPATESPTEQFASEIKGATSAPMPKRPADLSPKSKI